MDQPNQTTTFEHQSKDEWRTQAEIDLKGKSFDEVVLEVEPGLVLDPLYTHEEVDQFAQLPILWSPSTNGWKIAERFYLNEGLSEQDLNASIMNALEGGCEVLEIIVADDRSVNFDLLLENVQLDLILLRLKLNARSLDNWKLFLKENKKERKGIDGVQIFENHIDQINVKSDQHPSSQLAAITLAIKEKLRSGKNWDQLFISFPIGSHILVEMAKIRALKLLVYAISEEQELPLNTYPVIQSQVSSSHFTNELESVIERTCKVFSAVLAGVDEMSIDWEFETAMELDEKDKRRLLRNINWLLKLESQLGAKSDIIQGASWIERCTQELFHRAWQKSRKGDDG